MGPGPDPGGLQEDPRVPPLGLRLGVTLYWEPNSHNDNPYSFNREFIYKWVTASDGGWDLKRILPDPSTSAAAQHPARGPDPLLVGPSVK